MASLRIGGVAIGCLCIVWNQPREIEAGDVKLLTTVAAQTSAAIERARLFEDERDARRQTELARRRMALLAEASAQLAAGGDETEQLTFLARLLANGFADAISVLLLDSARAMRRRIIVASDPAVQAMLQPLLGTVLIDEDPQRMAAWAAQRPFLIQNATPDRLAQDPSVSPELAERVDQFLLGGCSIAAPLLASGHRLGMFVAWRTGHRAAFDDEDAQLLADLGCRAGVAVSNLRMLATQTHIAARLQETLLPGALPSIAGVELAARYLPAEQGTEIGGDFYDAFAIGDSYALVIGDVAGRGAGAAGLTGVARTALRVLADHLDPPAMLSRLNTLLTERPGGVAFLTLAFLLLRPHPGGATIHTWLAGHPPPQLVHLDGTTCDLGVCGDLLGVLPEVTHHRHMCEAVSGDLVLLYTDGLTETRGPDGLYGEAHLPAQIAGLAGATAASAVERLTRAVAEYCGGRSGDDTAILAARLVPPDDPD